MGTQSWRKRSNFIVDAKKIMSLSLFNLNNIWRKKMSLLPLHDNLLVKLEEVKEKKEGGLILPESAKEKSKIALVLEVGPGKLNKDGTRSETVVKKGDRVLFR